MNMIIYGAQGYALGAYNAIKVLYPEHKVLCFAVTSMGNNADTLGGLPVRQIDEVADDLSDDEKKSIHVLIATPENVQDEIVKTLEQYGFTDHERLSSALWDELMRKLNGKTGEFLSLASMPEGTEKPPVHIYVAKSHKDRPLKNAFELPPYMIPIQVGAANTDERIADVRDNEGENISVKNGNYCEMTGLYWVWKNVLAGDFRDSDYYGFAQYRRHLMLSDDDFKRLAANDIDVVLPYPLMYEPDINAHHDRYLKENDWNALLRTMEELCPDDCQRALPEALKQQYMYNYNVILAKAGVLRDYCAWLFPILKRVEETTVPKGSERADRYIGYIAETLETVYFMKNRDRLKIAHAGCRLLV